MKENQALQFGTPADPQPEENLPERTDAHIPSALSIGFAMDGSFSPRPKTAGKVKHSHTKTCSNVKLLNFSLFIVNLKQ